MLQLHPKKAEAWIACAKFQLEDLGETDVARKSLQRGLRFLPNDALMWKEYFRLELHYWEKLLKRQEVLGWFTAIDLRKRALLDTAFILTAYSEAFADSRFGQ